MRMLAMPSHRQFAAAAAIGIVAALMQGCNKVFRDEDWEGNSQLNTSWRTPGMDGYESASAFCKLDWSYQNASGWGDLPGSQCGHEGDQSPIHLDLTQIIDNTSETGENQLGPPDWMEGDTKIGITQVPERHAWTFDVVGGQAGIRWKGKEYNLTNFHIHSPSEHTFDGNDGFGPQRYPAELHLVNTAADGSTLMVAVFYVIDKPDVELARLAYDIGAVHQGDIPINSTIKQTINNPYQWPLVRYGIETYYTYEGSQTTPPCETGVTWMVMKQTRMMDQWQLSQFRGALQSSSCDSLPSSHRWVDNAHANPQGDPPNCNAEPRNAYVGDYTSATSNNWEYSQNNNNLPNCNPTTSRTHCPLLSRIPGLSLILPCAFTSQHQSWLLYPKWNRSAAAGENNRPLQPIGDRKVYMYLYPTPVSLQIIETIFIISVSYAIFSIYFDQREKHAVRDKSRREWLNSIGVELPTDLVNRLVRVDARDAARARAAEAEAARAPADAGNAVAPNDAGAAAPLLG